MGQQFDMADDCLSQILARNQQLLMTDLDSDQRPIAKSINSIVRAFLRFHRSEWIDFEEVCDNLPDAIYISDGKGKTVYINSAYERMSDIDRREIVGKDVYKINEEKKFYENGIIPVVLRTHEVSDNIGLMVRTNTPVHMYGFPIWDKLGGLRYAVACDRDIKQLQTIRGQLLKLQEASSKVDEEIRYLRTRQAPDLFQVSNSEKTRAVIDTARSVAATDASVLITGESGTGKEVVANFICHNSNRSEEPFIKVNCAAIPEALMESELFGYEPGAFTGANRGGKTGLFELANNGTLLLDEIGEMPVSMQTKLLRALQNQEIMKVGGNRAIPVNVRIIAATNKDLQRAIREHAFREDLYYRLNVVPIAIAPLRERREEIIPFANHFLNIYSRKYNKNIQIDRQALEVMENYDWPGNIRELENVIERLVVINKTGTVSPESASMILGIQDRKPAPVLVKEAAAAPQPESFNLKEATARVEMQLIKEALKRYPSVRKAAAALGIDHSTLIKKCRRYGIGSAAELGE
ncbi:MAG: sigma 54-interacting transcriptional regulator [Lachnospiraceae bacterium]|nr:sigma 54-interacting transcriptional regulator [Lachnospiraceae bacterium]